MTGLSGLGQLDTVASASHMELEEVPPAARGRKGLAREVVQETDPYEDPDLRRWVQDDEIREMMESV